MFQKNSFKRIWSYSEDIDTHTLETHIYSLRKNFKKSYSKTIDQF